MTTIESQDSPVSFIEQKQNRLWSDSFAFKKTPRHNIIHACILLTSETLKVEKCGFASGKFFGLLAVFVGC
jgi:hypothetical protein